MPVDPVPYDPAFLQRYDEQIAALQAEVTVLQGNAATWSRQADAMAANATAAARNADALTSLVARDVRQDANAKISAKRDELARIVFALIAKRVNETSPMTGGWPAAASVMVQHAVLIQAELDKAAPMP